MKTAAAAKMGVGEFGVAAGASTAVVGLKKNARVRGRGRGAKENSNGGEE